MRTSAIFLLYILAIVCLLCGCKQVQYVPVETVRLDSIYLTQTLRDSIVRYDSVYVRDKGDTLYVERWKYLYRDKVRVDTMVSVCREVLHPHSRQTMANRYKRNIAEVLIAVPTPFPHLPSRHPPRSRAC